ncbi:hypothetical protein SAMN05660199_04452 [Klenkia soli]|uniref:Uncharacterized protein n=1 Tax=Klenkia soli TaxID=1052260 RepID=A0A1H0UCG0_9ACTN|nr:hypothetical protein [Klenkia soli]SDP63854.1 hypothetical protein SAMN05660199_04452 [Klenkia soli]
MEPVAVDLPPLAELRDRWAAAAAVVTALGFPAAAHARGPRSWRWDDGGGNRAEVAVLDADRAVLFGWDRTAHGRLLRRPDGEPSGELLADAPGWWSDPLRGTTDEVGFVLGWDGAGWSRSAGIVPGGGLAGIPVDAEQLYGVVDSFVEGVADDQGLGDWRTPWPAVAALGRAGAGLTVEQLADVLGPLRADLPAGVVAARRFGAD